MEEQATPAEGVSIHDRLMAKLSDEPLPEQDETTDEEVKKESVSEEVEEQPEDGAKEGVEPLLTTADLAQYMGVDESLIDVDDDGSPVIKAKVDGVETKAKLKDLVESYQLRSHYDKKIYEAAEQQKVLAGQFAAEEAALSAKLQEANDIIDLYQQNLNREFAAVDWQSLRENNPGEYAALYADYQARQQSIASSKANIEAQRIQRQKAEMERQREDMEKTVASEAEKLDRMIPTWRNEKDEVTAWAKDYLAKWGEDVSILNNVTKGMVIDLLRTKMMFERGQKEKSIIEKKIRVAPKLVKSGHASTPQENQESSMKQMRKSIVKSGGRKGVADYLIATGRA